MPERSKNRRPRRQFDEEFRAQPVRLVLDDGKTVGAVARDLDLTPSALRLWVTRAQGNRTHGRTGLTTAEREEFARLRKENRELRTERDILKNRGLLREAPVVRFGWVGDTTEFVIGGSETLPRRHHGSAFQVHRGLVAQRRQ